MKLLIVFSVKAFIDLDLQVLTSTHFGFKQESSLKHVQSFSKVDHKLTICKLLRVGSLEPLLAKTFEGLH